MTNPHLPPGALLAAALQQLVDDYPTDDAVSVVLTVTDLDEPGRGEPIDIKLQPGQAAWLTSLVMDEGATCRNAHPGGNDQCGHCRGTGRVRGADEPPADDGSRP
ncbi:hypothetical protein ACFOSC_27685 [Streptantibioticus rubrisoli]|uniref:Uncharacterized protein n=1 Tax=Streptantibioticus rubrisoli TaxID=1387313 RepID=A0ABT1PKB3_9ACTN|nr:hypothetical protein [Streptantibioticus rubrisoli]MCQ4045805.1 hypothetical protein [Streptantibioticus rubrisoli]